MTTEQNMYCETLYYLSYYAGLDNLVYNLDYDSVMLFSLIKNWEREFEEKHKENDFIEKSFMEEIHDFYIEKKNMIKSVFQHDEN